MGEKGSTPTLLPKGSIGRKKRGGLKSTPTREGEKAAGEERKVSSL